MDARDAPGAAVIVDFLDVNDLALDQIAEGLPGDVPEWLGFLGGIDAVEPDFDLPVLAVEAGERVAVSHRHDLELLGLRDAGEGQEEEEGGGKRFEKEHWGSVPRYTSSFPPT